MNSGYINKHIFLFVLCYISTVLLIGCSSAPIVITPNYNSPAFIKDTLNTKIKIVKTIDNRPYISKYNAGAVQVGAFNTIVNYNLSEPVSNFVETALTKTLNIKNDNTFVPVTVIIDNFLVSESTGAFSEKGYFDCSMRFRYPQSNDSIKTIKAAVKKSSSGMDVTNSLEGLIYSGMSDCAHQFALKFNESNNYFLTSSVKTDSISKNLIPGTKTTISVGDTIHKIEEDNASCFAFTYFSGDKITGGLQLAYHHYTAQKSSRQFQHGWGLSLSYYNIENRKDFLSGYFIGGGGRYGLKYFINPSRKGLYFGGAIRLTLGSEVVRVEHYWASNKEITKFFIGPTLEETIGLSISEQVFIEAGCYQIKHFGSNLLPDDIGFNAGIGFAL